MRFPLGQLKKLLNCPHPTNYTCNNWVGRSSIPVLLYIRTVRELIYDPVHLAKFTATNVYNSGGIAV